MRLDFTCGHCSKEYPLIVSSGHPLIFVTQEVKDSMSPDCIPYFKAWYDWGAMSFWGYDFKQRRPDWTYRNGEGVWGA